MFLIEIWELETKEKQEEDSLCFMSQTEEGD